MSFLDKFSADKIYSHVETVQDLISKDIFDTSGSSDNQDMLNILQFMRLNGVPLTDSQVQAWFLLNEFGLADLALYMQAVRPLLTPTKMYFDMVNKITLADRIKGTARLDKLLKASVANPNNQVSAAEVTPKGLHEKELGRV